MNPHNRQLFVILVHYGTPAVTIRAIESLYAGSAVPTGVVIIDHGHTPLGVLSLPGVKVIRPADNAGYGAGINMGLGALVAEQAELSDIVVVMNNDITVQPDTISQLLSWWQQHPTPAQVGVVVEEQGQRVYGGGKINPWSGRANLSYTKPRRVDYIHGAFFCAPYEVLLSTQGLPEHYFLYWEDVLLSRRIKQRGFPLRVASRVHVRHAQNAQPPSAQQVYYLVRNGALFMTQEMVWPLRTWWGMYNRARLFYHQYLHQPPRPIIVRALRDGIRGKTGPRKVAV